MMENFNLLPEFTLSQESDLGEDELDELVLQSEPVSTKKSTNWGMKILMNWADKRNRN